MIKFNNEKWKENAMEKEERSMQHLEEIVCCSDHSAFHILAQVFHIYHTFTINLDVLAKLKGHLFSMYAQFFEKLTFLTTTYGNVHVRSRGQKVLVFRKTLLTY